jgi:uncharacterized protein YndB with AHSA1/START domain
MEENAMPTKSATSKRTAGDKSDAAPGAGPLIIRRTFDAPRDLVWEVWSDPSQAKHWWGPTGFTLPFVEMDQRVGGKWRAQMHSPDGKDLWQHGVYREIDPPETTIYTFVWDAEPEHEMLVTVTFVARGNKTDMTFKQEGFNSRDEKAGHEDGWNQTFDRFVAYLKTVQGGMNARR